MWKDMSFHRDIQPLFIVIKNGGGKYIKRFLIPHQASLAKSDSDSLPLSLQLMAAIAA